jgi:hypothetical protein
VDGAGASHGLVNHITTLNARPGYRVHYSIGWELGPRERAAINRVPHHAFDAAVDIDGQPRSPEQASVVELTALLREHPDGDRLANWPADLRIIARREKPHPGAQLSLFEQAQGWRYQLVATNTPGKTAQFLEARHRPHARVEDCIRTGKQTGLGHLTSTSIEINRAWCLAATIACDLLCWLRLLCLDGSLARAEPKTLRYRLLHTPYPHRARLTQTQDPYPRHLALGPATHRLPARRARPAPTDPMLINHAPSPTRETIRTTGIRRPPDATAGPRA